MANIPPKGKYNPPWRPMPGAPLPSLPARQAQERILQLASQNEFTNHLQHYLTDTPSPQSGARGIHLNKLDRNDNLSHAYIYEVEGTPVWGHGMDAATPTTGFADYVSVFDNSGNAGSGADVFRWSREADAPAGTSATCKFVAGRMVGTPRSQNFFGAFSGGDNVTGLGGISISMWDEGGNKDALQLVNRSTNKKRTVLNFNNQYELGTDMGNTNAQSFTLYDSVLPGNILSFDNTGKMEVFHNAKLDGTLEVVGVTTHDADVVISGHNIITDTVTGSQIATGSTQKLGFFGATPSAQIGGSTDVLAGMVTLGFRGASSNPPLNLGTGSITAGVSSFSDVVTITANPSAPSQRCLTLNADIAATIFVQPKSGLKFGSIKINGAYQWASDPQQTNTNNFQFQNLASGNFVWQNTAADLFILGNAAAAGGVQVGVTGGNVAFYGTTPVAQPAGTTDVLASLVTLGLRAASSNPPLNLGTGALNCGALSATTGNFSGSITGTLAGFSGPQALSGSGGTGLSFKESVPSPPSDADYTLTSSQADAFIVVPVQGSWLSGHNLIFPNTVGAVWLVNNLTGFTATCKTAAGSGVAIANGKTAIIWGNGTSLFRATPDT